MPETFFTEAVAGFRVKRDYVVAELGKIPAVSCAVPEGAFYVFPVITGYYGPFQKLCQAPATVSSFRAGTTSPSGAVMTNSNDICVFILDVRMPRLYFGGSYDVHRGDRKRKLH